MDYIYRICKICMGSEEDFVLAKEIDEIERSQKHTVVVPPSPIIGGRENNPFLYPFQDLILRTKGNV